MNEVRELIDTELDTVSGGLFDVGVNVQTIVNPQIALAVGGPGIFAPGGGATGCERRWSTDKPRCQRVKCNKAPAIENARTGYSWRFFCTHFCPHTHCRQTGTVNPR